MSANRFVPTLHFYLKNLETDCSKIQAVVSSLKMYPFPTLYGNPSKIPADRQTAGQPEANITVRRRTSDKQLLVTADHFRQILADCGKKMENFRQGCYLFTVSSYATVSHPISC